MPRAEATLEDVYNDLLNLGRIFDVQTRAETLVAQMRRSVSDVEKAWQANRRPGCFCMTAVKTGR